MPSSQTRRFKRHGSPSRSRSPSKEQTKKNTKACVKRGATRFCSNSLKALKEFLMGKKQNTSTPSNIFGEPLSPRRSYRAKPTEEDIKAAREKAKTILNKIKSTGKAKAIIADMKHKPPAVKEYTRPSRKSNNDKRYQDYIRKLRDNKQNPLPTILEHYGHVPGHINQEFFPNVNMDKPEVAK